MVAYRLAAPVFDRVFGRGTVSGLDEWELLRRYLDDRDEIAFEALVTRHAPMVQGVCRRMLGDQAEVEDAFQATFLVLVRRARQLGPGDSLGAWLYGVAVRVAMRARSTAARRSRFEPIDGERAAALATVLPGDRELRAVLDQEVDRLPAKYRSPIVLCYVEGQTHEEAARQLNWPLGTVKGRLARARDLLRSRLMRRGVAPSAGTLVLALSPESYAALPRELFERTVKASLKIALGAAPAQVVSTSIATLVEGALTSMRISTLKSAGLAALACALFLFTAGVMARQPSGSKAYDTTSASGAASEAAEAALQPGQGRGGGAAPRRSAPTAVDDEVGQDPKSKIILAKLDEPISMAFQEETPLEDVLKYLAQATVSPELPKGMPIYVDPVGLSEADRNMTSTVRNINLEGIPLRRTLQLVMKQLDLGYFVVDGMLYITSAEAAKRPLESPMQRPSALNQRVDKAERGELTMDEMKDLVEFLKTRRLVLALHEENDVAIKAAENGSGAPSKPAKSREAKPDEPALDSLIKELRELVAALKAEKATPKKTANIQ
jgi:RNA polymerase sigma factor (sigma-70 family)